MSTGQKVACSPEVFGEQVSRGPERRELELLPGGDRDPERLGALDELPLRGQKSLLCWRDYDEPGGSASV